MLLVGYCFGIRSETPAMRGSASQSGLSLVLSMGLDGDVPDHSTFSKNRHGRFRDSDLLRRFFETVVAALHNEGSLAASFRGRREHDRRRRSS